MAAKQRTRKPIKQVKAQQVTAGTVIRMQKPKSTRGNKHTASDVAIVVAQEMNPVSGFVGFLREHAVVGLAVGFAIATQAQALIKQLITSFIDPLYALLFSGDALSKRTTTLHWHGRSQPFGWGAFVYTLIDFIFVLVMIYLIIKIFNLDKLDKPADKK